MHLLVVVFELVALEGFVAQLDLDALYFFSFPLGRDCLGQLLIPPEYLSHLHLIFLFLSHQFFIFVRHLPKLSDMSIPLRVESFLKRCEVLIEFFVFLLEGALLDCQFVDLFHEFLTSLQLAGSL